MLLVLGCEWIKNKFAKSIRPVIFKNLIWIFIKNMGIWNTEYELLDEYNNIFVIYIWW